ncbi:MAG: M15 family metallopeptidase [Cyanobacteriota bacterium]|nr:M15 family metallopeptidase [Cyanobacteriota bacterium]
MKDYQRVPICECGEPLVPIPPDRFAFESPHPYEKIGAPYGKRSPFFLRQGVLDRLIAAQTHLQQQQPGWRIQIFDAYRPVEVQQYMVDYTFEETVRSRGLSLAELTPTQRQEILSQVYQFWAVPSLDPALPPPHSTGAAIDVTLVDAENRPVDMGSPIDEMSPRSYPNHFAQSTDAIARQYHHHRQRLADAMTSAGLIQHPREWWHFSFGDQLWVWLSRSTSTARYGRVMSDPPSGRAM